MDGCFYQHGPLQQTGSYGEDFVHTLMQYVAAAENTSFAITGAPEVALSTLLLDGQQVRVARCRRVRQPFGAVVSLP